MIGRTYEVRAVRKIFFFEDDVNDARTRIFFKGKREIEVLALCWTMSRGTYHDLLPFLSGLEDLL